MDAYTPQSDAERSLFDARLLSDPDQGVRTMTQTLFERFHQKGRQEGQRESLVLLLEARFGSLPEPAKQRIQGATAEQLQQWLLDFAQSRTLLEMGLQQE